jgi:hypothetical protein
VLARFFPVEFQITRGWSSIQQNNQELSDSGTRQEMNFTGIPDFLSTLRGHAGMVCVDTEKSNALENK